MIHSMGLPRWLSGKESACNSWIVMQEMQFDRGSGRSPGLEPDSPLCILAWIIPWTEETGELQSMGSQRVTQLSD